MSLPVPWVSPEVVDRILLVAEGQGSLETCGVVTPDSQVVQLPNISPSPTRAFEISSEDLVNSISEYVDRAGVDPTELTRGHFIIWHTHPSGLIGPSKGDIKNKVEGFQYVVITLPTKHAVQF